MTKPRTILQGGKKHKRKVAPYLDQNLHGEGRRGREGRRGGENVGTRPNLKGERFGRKVNQGPIFVNDLGKLNPSGEIPGDGRKAKA